MIEDLQHFPLTPTLNCNSFLFCTSYSYYSASFSTRHHPAGKLVRSFPLTGVPVQVTQGPIPWHFFCFRIPLEPLLPIPILLHMDQFPGMRNISILSSRRRRKRRNGTFVGPLFPSLCIYLTRTMRGNFSSEPGTRTQDHPES